MLSAEVLIFLRLTVSVWRASLNPPIFEDCLIVSSIFIYITCCCYCCCCCGGGAFYFPFLLSCVSSFGGLEVVCWPLVPKFAGSNTIEAVGFFRAKKILSTPSFSREVKPFVPRCIFAACKRTWKCMRGSRSYGSKLLAISHPSSSSFHY